VLACSIVVASCSGTKAETDADLGPATTTSAATAPVAEPDSSPTSPPVDTASEDAEPADTVAATTAPAEPAEIGEPGLLTPGTYASDLLTLELEVTTTTDFRVSDADPGRVIFESLSSSPTAFTAVAFLVVDTLIDADVLGRQRARLPATSDLGEFLESRDRVQVIDHREDELGGIAASVWRIGYPDGCDDCWFEALFNTTGFQNQLGILPGYVQEIWTIDAPGSPIIVMVEAPEDSFNAWNDDVQRHLFDQLDFGAPTGYSLQHPTGDAFAEGFGEYGIGRAELEVIDPSRPTIEVGNEIGLVVPSADERRLMLSVAYPSDVGGFGATPADGSFPLVVVAPALNDAAIVLPAERQLASHGFVVVTVRFPESSFPGGAVTGIPQQPADISFVIDEVSRGALPPDITAAIDLERIGVIGHSGGATTAFGLLAYDCCHDDRVDAVAAHGGTPYNFNSSTLPTVAPILHVVSNGDQIAPAEAVREFHETTDGPSSLAVLADASHLEWLPPDADEYGGAFDLVLAFLDLHLRDAPVDLATVAAESEFIEFDDR
jgi:dienelactone hydrolase